MAAGPEQHLLISSRPLHRLMEAGVGGGERGTPVTGATLAKLPVGAFSARSEAREKGCLVPTEPIGERNKEGSARRGGGNLGVRVFEEGQAGGAVSRLCGRRRR